MIPWYEYTTLIISEWFEGYGRSWLCLSICAIQDMLGWSGIDIIISCFQEPPFYSSYQVELKQLWSDSCRSGHRVSFRRIDHWNFYFESQDYSTLKCLQIFWQIWESQKLSHKFGCLLCEVKNGHSFQFYLIGIAAFIIGTNYFNYYS